MIKSTLLNLMKGSGAFSLVRAANRRQALILTYHRFSTREDEGWTTPRAFAEQLEYLNSHYKILPLGKLVEHLQDPNPVPPNLAAITIDDGYRDSYEIAYPLLKRYNAAASLFVVTEFAERRIWIWTDKARYLCASAARQQTSVQVGESQVQVKLDNASSRAASALKLNDQLKKLPNGEKEAALERIARILGVFVPKNPPEELQSVTWDQAREMDRNGIEIGSHTMTHPILTNISDDQLQQELAGSKLKLEEELGRKVTQFCYPNGDNDGRVQCEVARAGYRIAVTCIEGLNKKGDDPITLRRIHTEHDISRFIQSTCGFEVIKLKARGLGKRLLVKDVGLSTQGADHT